MPILGQAPRMLSENALSESTLTGSLALPAQTLRNFKKTMLAGKRRFRYQVYGCACFIVISRF